MSILLIVFISCTTSIKYTALNPTEKSKPIGCPLDIYMPQQEIERQTKVLGTIFIVDAGLTIGCGWEAVLKQAKERACTEGADAVQFYDIKEPFAGGSSCYQIQAHFLKYLD